MECKCDMRTKLIGDGCEVCNPEKALWYAKQTISEQEAAIKELVEMLKAARELCHGVYPDCLADEMDELIDKYKTTQE